MTTSDLIGWAMLLVGAVFVVVDVVLIALGWVHPLVGYPAAAMVTAMMFFIGRELWQDLR